MGYRILITNDWHMDYRGPSTIKNYLDIQNERIELMLKVKKELKLNAMIIAGDFCDGGYHDQTKLMSHRNMAEALAKGLDFCDLLLGNHFYTERDTNLEMYLIQPHAVHKPKEYFFSERQIFTTPMYRVIEGVQISLFHYSKNDKYYVKERLSDAKRHIGIYHDESVLPRSINANMHIPIEVESDYFRAIYMNIDYAFCAHIHKPFGLQYIKLPHKTVPVYIPGSIAITENSETENHLFENLLLLEIDNGTFTTAYIEFPTFYEKLKFTEKKVKVTPDLQDFSDLSTVIREDARITLNISKKESLYSFLANKKGYSENSLATVQRATQGKISIDEAIELLYKEDLN